MDIGIISCVSKKKKGVFKAKELYTSDLFKKSLNYCLKHYDKTYILSAKYGFLLLDDFIEDYDLTLNNFKEREKKIWAYHTYRQMINHIDNKHDVLFWHCGVNYRKYLMKKFTKNKTPLKGLGIGFQLKWYKQNT